MAELGISWHEAWLTVVTAVGVYSVMIVLSRIFGQRQFSTTTTYDLAFVFAMGSLIGRVLLVRVSLANATLGLAVMFGLHTLTGWLHHNIGFMHRLIQNRPVLLIAQGRLLEENVRRSHTSRYEIYQRIRQQSLGDLEEVAAVVLERDGTMSVLRRGTAIDPELFSEVSGREQLQTV